MRGIPQNGVLLFWHVSEFEAGFLAGVSSLGHLRNLQDRPLACIEHNHLPTFDSGASEKLKIWLRNCKDGMRPSKHFATMTELWGAIGGAGKEVLSLRLIAYGPNSKAVAGVGFGGRGAVLYQHATMVADP